MQATYQGGAPDADRQDARKRKSAVEFESARVFRRCRTSRQLRTSKGWAWSVHKTVRGISQRLFCGWSVTLNAPVRSLAYRGPRSGGWVRRTSCETTAFAAITHTLTRALPNISARPYAQRPFRRAAVWPTTCRESSAPSRSGSGTGVSRKGMTGKGRASRCRSSTRSWTTRVVRRKRVRGVAYRSTSTWRSCKLSRSRSGETWSRKVRVWPLVGFG